VSRNLAAKPGRESLSRNQGAKACRELRNRPLFKPFPVGRLDRSLALEAFWGCSFVLTAEAFWINIHTF
jgi:hypothetical protein